MGLIGLFATLGTTQAAMITLNNFSNTDRNSPSTGFANNGTVSGTDGSVDGDASAGDGSSGATIFDVSTFVADDVASPAALAYTVTGLNIDGVGGFNDSFVINFTVSTDGQNLQTNWSGTEPQNAGWLSSGGNTLNSNGELVQFDFSSISVNLNGGSDNGVGSWLGFTGGSIGAFAAGEIAIVNGNLHEFDVDGNPFDLTAGGNDNNLQVLRDTNAGASGSYRPESWSFQVEVNVVPEPSSAALLGLGGLALILRRRK